MKTWVASTALLSVAFGALATMAQAEEPTAVRKAPATTRVTVSPLRFDLGGAQQTDTLRVANPSTRQVGVQVRVFAWTQTDGEDVYTPTTDVIATPSIITIQPGDTQAFRIVRRAGANASEGRYRVIVDQLPDPELSQAGQAMTRIRFSIPMFTNRDKVAPAKLDWSVRGNQLLVANSGQQTARMVNLSLTNSLGAPLTVDGVSLHYVMPGSSLAWTLPGGCPAGSAKITLDVDGEPVDAPVAVACS